MRLFVSVTVALAVMLMPAVISQASDNAVATTETAAAKAPAKAAPIPFLSIEGYSGGAITPMAYLCNPGAPGTTVSMPSVAYTFVSLGSKQLQTVAITQVFFNRLELGYAYNHLDLGTQHADIAKAGLDMGQGQVDLHHFNARFNILPENSFDLPLPALTAGVHFKYNDGIKGINRSLGGALSGLGYEKTNGVDYTLTASKMLPKLAYGRPVILTGGLRFSKASQIGYYGFGDECKLTFEGSVAYLPLDNIVLAYEFRGKNNPYDELDGLQGEEDNWHAFSASWIASDRLTVTGLYGNFGNIANADADCVLGIQLKYEF